MAAHCLWMSIVGGQYMGVIDVVAGITMNHDVMRLHQVLYLHD